MRLVKFELVDHYNQKNEEMILVNPDHVTFVDVDEDDEDCSIIFFLDMSEGIVVKGDLDFVRERLMGLI